VLNQTGNLKLVMDWMGHTDGAAALKYQHPQLELVRQALNARHILRHSGEKKNFNC
jgi:hypothetical protein